MKKKTSQDDLLKGTFESNPKHIPTSSIKYAGSGISQTDPGYLDSEVSKIWHEKMDATIASINKSHPNTLPPMFPHDLVIHYQKPCFVDVDCLFFRGFKYAPNTNTAMKHQSQAARVNVGEPGYLNAGNSATGWNSNMSLKWKIN